MAATTDRITLADRVAGAPRELKLFVFASLFMGMAYSVYDATFNNFLDARFTLTGFQRSFLEFPRELPGLLTAVVTAIFWFWCSRRLGAAALAVGAVGAILIGFASTSYPIMVVWLFIYSLGSHVFLPIASTIGMELAADGKTGQRLGQLNAIRNLAAIFGSFVVFVGFKHLNFTFNHTFLIIAVGLSIAFLLLISMKRVAPRPSTTFLKFYKPYSLYYWLTVLYGSRKQLFMTFAPWVLVTIFDQPTQIIATLLLIGGVIGILFQPLLGWLIDHLGERLVLTCESVMLVFVCLGYGFARSWFPENVAFYLVCACFLMDQMLMSVGMARSTYMKKIAEKPEDVQPALTLAVSIDHVFSISIALLGGVIWNTFGFQYVFLMGVVIALINIFAALHVRVPETARSTV